MRYGFVANAQIASSKTPRNDVLFYAHGVALVVVRGAKTWIMWDRSQVDDSNNYTGFHRPGGSNVLFLDGHVEFMKFEDCGPAPANLPFAKFMQEAFGP